jgi:hypothetical protein
MCFSPFTSSCSHNLSSCSDILHCFYLSGVDRLSLYRCYVLFVSIWRDSPQGARASSFRRFFRSHTTTHHIRKDSSGRVISSSHRPLPDNTQHSQQTSMSSVGFEPRNGAAVDLRLILQAWYARKRGSIRRRTRINVCSEKSSSALRPTQHSVHWIPAEFFMEYSTKTEA